MTDLALIPDRRNSSETADLGVRLRGKLVGYRCDERGSAVAWSEVSIPHRHDRFLERPVPVAHTAPVTAAPDLITAIFENPVSRISIWRFKNLEMSGAFERSSSISATQRHFT
jgi:hypothetical protein